MNPSKSCEHNDFMKKLSVDIDMVINSLQLAERDPDTSYQSASLIQLCINQLGHNLKGINNKFGNDWPENTNAQ